MRSLIGLLFAAMPLSAVAAELRDVRLWASPDGTRVVFDLDGAAEHTLFSLPDPNRVVIDLKQTRRAAALATTLQGKGLVQRVRSGTFADGALRVVLDLDAAVSSRSFSLAPNAAYGYRVVVDLAPQAAAGTTPASSSTPVVTASLDPALKADSPGLSPQDILDGAEAPPPAASARPRLTERPLIVAIDAGHGGEDPGAQGKRGTLEKEVCLDLARKLAALVDREPGMKAVLIRDGDYYIGLRQRVAKAQAARADLFVSIHANSFRDPKVRGTAVYVLSPKGARSEHAIMLENRENMSDLIGGVDVEHKDDTTAAVLVDILQTSAMEASYDAGERLLHSMGRVNALQKAAVQQASFVVLKSASFPSVLVETAFLTNEREERLLRDPQHQDRLARSMLEGIRGYFESYRPAPGQTTARAGGGLQPVSLAR